jgi:hypothetical protein
MSEKYRKIEENMVKSGKSTENERNLNKMLFNARRVIKEKEKEIENLKAQLKTSTSISSNNFIPSTNNLVSSHLINDTKPNLELSRPSIDKPLNKPNN